MRDENSRLGRTLVDRPNWPGFEDGMRAVGIDTQAGGYAMAMCQPECPDGPAYLKDPWPDLTHPGTLGVIEGWIFDHRLTVALHVFCMPGLFGDPPFEARWFPSDSSLPIRHFKGSSKGEVLGECLLHLLDLEAEDDDCDDSGPVPVVRATGVVMAKVRVAVWPDGCWRAMGASPGVLPGLTPRADNPSRYPSVFDGELASTRKDEPCWGWVSFVLEIPEPPPVRGSQVGEVTLERPDNDCDDSDCDDRMHWLCGGNGVGPHFFRCGEPLDYDLGHSTHLDAVTCPECLDAAGENGWRPGDVPF